MPLSDSRHTRGVPPIIHGINVAALPLIGLILLLTAVAQFYQLLILLPILVLLVVYWRLRKDPRVAAGYFGLALALTGWIVICENVVALDNALGTELSRSLQLAGRLRSYVNANLHTSERRSLEACCDDPLTWHYQPGSAYRATFDCATCNPPYEVVVDETGYLNQHPGTHYSDQRIDLFLAGDSVLQGMGVPSVVEWLRPQMPLRMWNLSVQAYAARQKVNALIAYALPKKPQWLILEFHAGNDLPEAIRDDVCEGLGDFRCRYDEFEIRQRLAQHPGYQAIFDLGDGAAFTRMLTSFAVPAAHNLTLATTRYLIDRLKGAIKTGLLSRSNNVSEDDDEETRVYSSLANPAGGGLPVRRGQRLAYLNAGLALTLRSYERLVASLEDVSPAPMVILLYNPTPRELYRELAVDHRPEANQVSAMQRETLRAFAHRHGWRWLDLTEPLRKAVLPQKVWLYGRYDRSHYSPQGTAVVATVLATELLKIIGPHVSGDMGGTSYRVY